MTIDAPFTCCWSWTLVLGYLALFRRAGWAWPAAGLIVGLGILAKYTMVLWIGSFVLFLVLTPGYRRVLLQTGFWLMTGIATLCALPILWWNAEHHWLSVRHVAGQAGLSRGWQVDWTGPLRYVAVQCALLLGFWFVAWVRAAWDLRPRRGASPVVRYLWWMSMPTFVWFLAFSLRTNIEPNWPVAGYLSALVLTVPWLVGRLHSAQGWIGHVERTSLGVICALGIVVTALIHHSEWLQPALAWCSGPPSPAHPLPLRRLDPTCRLRGWRSLAKAVDAQRMHLRQEGIDALIAGSNWTLPGELGFYCAGQPAVYSLGPALGDRHSQYDLWRPNPIADADRFAGRTFIFIGEPDDTLKAAFERLEPSMSICYSVRGHPVVRWTLTVCRNFRGIPESFARRDTF